MCPSSTSSSELGGASAARSFAPEGLIETPETFGGGKFARLTVLLVFFGLLVGTGLVDTVHPKPLPSLLGDEKTQDDRIREQAELWDGSWARLFENDLRLKSRVRRKLAEPYTWFLYSALGEAKDIIVGREGWLFSKARAQAPKPNARVVAHRTANQLVALDRLLHSHGMELVAAPIPRKSVVLEDWLPRGVLPERELELELVRSLRACGVPTADLLTAFEAKDASALFHFGDSHWTTDAEVLAAEEISKVGGFRIPPKDRETELRAVENSALGLDLFRWISSDFNARTPRLQQYRNNRYQVFRIDDGTHVKRFNTGSIGRIALTGTSFSARRALGVLLTHCAGERVWNTARPGEGPMSPLRDFLGSLEETPWPEIMVVEFPVHLAMSARGMGKLAGLFEDWPPAEVVDVLPETDFKRAKRPIKSRRWSRIVELQGGRLGRSPDGTALLRLRGVSRGRVDIKVESAGSKLEYDWEPGREQLIVPLLGLGASSAQVYVSARAKDADEFDFEGAEVVAPIQAAPVATGRIRAPVRTETDRWSQDVRFPAESEVPRHGALVLAYAGQRVQGAVRVDILLKKDGDPAGSYTFRSLVKGAKIVLGLDGLAGERLHSLRLVGAGDPPERSLGSVSLHAPATR